MAWPLALLQISACQMTPLTAAARDGDVAAIYRLLESGAKVDETPEGKWRATPFYWSVFYCRYEAAQLLLKKGADPNAADTYGMAPLQLAVCCQSVKLSFIEELLQKGADIQYKNPTDGSTALHRAIACRADAAATLLIHKGADIHTADHRGTTPLILAVQKNSLPVAKLLLEKGADIHARDQSRKTALSYADGFFSKKKDMMELLKAAQSSKTGGKTPSPMDTSRYYLGIKGIVLKNGRTIEGQITGIDDDILKIRTKDGQVFSYSFMDDIERYITK